MVGSDCIFSASTYLSDDMTAITVTRANFDDAVLRTSGTQPVLVDFWAPWCGPCRVVSPIVEQIAQERPGRLKLVKINTDTAPNVSQRFGIRGIPTLVLLDHGKEVARIIGAHPAPTLNDWVDGHLGKTAASAT